MKIRERMKLMRRLKYGNYIILTMSIKAER